LNCVGDFLGDFLVHVCDKRAFEIFQFFERHAADYAIAKRLNFFFALLENRLNINSFVGAAIRLGDDDVLRHINETPCEVAGIRRLERGIRKTLTSAVRGDEVLQHVKTFAEV